MIAGGVAQGIGGLVSAFARKSMDVSSMTTPEIEKYIEKYEDPATSFRWKTEQSYAGNVRLAVEERERRAAGEEAVTTGSRAFAAVSTVTEVQANQMVGILETQRAQDAERNDILVDIATSNRSIEAATGISAGINLLRFQGM